MAAKHGQNFLYGAMVLTVAAVVVKVIGMFYKIPLGNILGGVGMSCFMMAYSIFTPVYSLSVSGFPAAISKMVSERMARGFVRDARRVFFVAILLLSGIGLVSFAVLFGASGKIAELIGNADAAPAIAAIAPALFFCCIMAVFRGYYQGLSDMAPTAISQVLESVAKLVCGVGLAWMVLQQGMKQYADTGMVFGNAAGSPAEAELLVLPMAAAAALLGVSISTVFGTLYLMIHRMVRGDGLKKKADSAGPVVMGRGKMLRELCSIALPVCLASMLAHVTNLIDVVTITRRIEVAMERNGALVLDMYAGLMPAGIDAAGLPSYLYGAYSGYTSSVFNLVPSITVALGISALPVIVSSRALSGARESARKITAVVKLTALIAIPAGLGIAALARPILTLLYPDRIQEVEIAANLLRSMGVAAVFTGIVTPVSSVFQAIGRPFVPVKLMAAGAVCKLILNYVLIARPEWNINAVPIGTIACYALILVASLLILQKEPGMEQNLLALMVKPLFCGILCAVAANTSHALLLRVIDSRLACLPAVAVGGAVYAIFILFLRILTENEVMMFPKGKKVMKILEKRSFLG